MINVMIVEDDVMFRYAIRTIIDWNSNGLNILYEAINGRHALNLMTNQIIPDIILTDISMPEMNGVDLIKEVKNIHPEVKIIVLSSYDEFEYVKDALKLGAEDYILKQKLNDDSLLKLLEETKIKIEMDKMKAAENKVYIKNLPAISDKFIRKVINGELQDINEIEINIKSFKLNLLTSNLIIGLIYMENINRNPLNDRSNTLIIPESNDYIRIALEEGIKSSKQSIIAEVDTGKYVLIVSLKDENSDAKIRFLINEITTQILSKVHNTLNMSVAIGVSEMCSNITNLSKYYLQAQKAVSERIYDGNNRIYFYNANVIQFSEVDIKIHMDGIYTALRSYNKDKIIEELDNLFNRLYKLRPDDISLKKLMIKLFTETKNLAEELDINFEFVSGTEFFPIEFFNDIVSLGSMHRYFKDYIMKLIDCMSDGKTNYSREVRKAIEFINSNYEKNIQVQNIAQAIDISSNYLSSIFKQETRMRIIEFINIVRVEEAKKLLRKTDLKSYEISDKVGFANASYFCTVFKDITGTTVNGYKRNPVS